MKQMKHAFLTGLSLLFSITFFAQGWVGESSTNSLNAVNAGLTTSPLNVGIGTLTPSAQLHTTGSLRFAGLTQNNSHNQLLVSDVNGNVFWRDAASITPPSNSWLLNGNAGTNPLSNFLGTTDNQSLIFKTNNIQRISISANTVSNSRNLSFVDIGRAGVSNELTSLNVWSRDVVGFSMPFFISSDVSGMSWNFTPGGNNTLGRVIRLNQGNTGTNGGSDFYDFGIDSGKNFFITEHGTPGANAFPVKMLNIDVRNRVGINMPWGTRPTAVFHTIGTVRHENLPSGSGDPLVIDVNGNVYRGFVAAKTTDQQDKTDIEILKKEIMSLKNELKLLKNKLGIEVVNTAGKQIPERAEILNISPNPASGMSDIVINIPKSVKKAVLIISSAEGRKIKEIAVGAFGIQSLRVNNESLTSGVYFCSLDADGKIADSGKMVIAR